MQFARQPFYVQDNPCFKLKSELQGSFQQSVSSPRTHVICNNCKHIKNEHVEKVFFHFIFIFFNNVIRLSG